MGNGSSSYHGSFSSTWKGRLLCVSDKFALTSSRAYKNLETDVRGIIFCYSTKELITKILLALLHYLS